MVSNVSKEILTRLEAVVVSSVKDACAGRKVGVLFSGGLDSSLIAKIASNHAEEVVLFTAGVEGSNDMLYSRQVAKMLGLERVEIILGEEEIISLYGEAQSIYPGELLKTELGVPILACCREARKRGVKVLLAGSGAEELFAGYHRHWEAWREGKDLNAMLEGELKALRAEGGDVERSNAIAKSEGVGIICPLLDERVVGIARSYPASENLSAEGGKKLVLREVAKALGVPELAYARKKQALQYGSGVHSVLLKVFGRKAAGKG